MTSFTQNRSVVESVLDPPFLVMTGNNNHNKRLDHLIMDHFISTTSSFKTPSLSSWTENSRSSIDTSLTGEASSESTATMAPVQSKLTDIKKQVKKMVHKVDRMMSSGETTDNISNSVHDFYVFMSQRFQGNQIYANTTVDQIEHLMDTTERMLMEDLFVKVTHKIQAEEESKDLELARKIKSLNWIMASHLDINMNLRCAKVRDYLDKAISDLIAMGSKSLPAEKLQCVYSCAQNVCKMLQQGTPGTTTGPTGVNRNPRGQNNFIKQKLVSADEFLPALVFVVIKSNPPLLQSNIRFITLFSNPNRLSSGEAGYYFTNLCCATAFVEKLTGSSLNLTEEEFNSYVSGECLPPGSSIESSMYLCSDAFRIMYSNISSAEDLIHKQNAIEFEISELKESMINFRKEVKNIVEPSIETSKKFLSIHYNVADDVDEKVIPSFMRERVREERRQRKERSGEGLLVDLTSIHSVDQSVNNQSNLLRLENLSSTNPMTTPFEEITTLDLIASPLPEPRISVTDVTYDTSRNQREDALLIDFNSSEESGIHLEDKQ